MACDDLLTLTMRRKSGRTEWVLLDGYDAFGRLPSNLLLRALPSKGLGVVAAREILCGSRLLDEAPLLDWVSVPEASSACSDNGAHDWEALEAAVDRLDPRSARAFWALFDKHAGHGDRPKTARGIWNSNALSTEDVLAGDGKRSDGDAGATVRSAVYSLCSRFNHACAPSAFAAWSTPLQRHTIHALRDIKAGEEITLACTRGGARA